MKYLFFLLTTLLLSFTFIDDTVIDRIGVKGPLTFNGTQFNLAWTDKPNATYYIQEYLPAGEKVESFHQLLTIHLFLKDITLENAVQQKTHELDNRKKTDPTCNYIAIQNPVTGEYIVDFLLGESKGDKMDIQEFNIYRYRKVDLGSHGKGILVYAYSKRAYGDAITPFLKSLKAERLKLINAMIAASIPPVTINDK